MRRVDPEGVLLRGLEMRVINRRHYHVAGPQCLWHIDENHKLIRLVLYQLFLKRRLSPFCAYFLSITKFFYFRLDRYYFKSIKPYK